MMPDDLVSKLQLLNRLNGLSTYDDSLGDNSDDPYSVNGYNGVNSYPNVSPQMSNLADIYRPRTATSEMYQQSLRDIPQRDNPSRLNRIFGALQALGGSVSPNGLAEGGQPVGFRYDPEKSQEIYDQSIYRPYYRKLSDWKMKTDALGKGAAEEDKYNINQRILANNTIQRQQAFDRQEEINRKDKASEADRAELRKRQQQDADTRRMNSAINKFKAENPHSVIRAAGDKLVAVNPLNNEATVLKDEDGNNLETGKLDDTTKFHIALQNQLAEIHARGEESRETEGVRSANTAKRQSDNITQRGEETRQTEDVRSANTAKRQSDNISQRGEETRKTNAVKPQNSNTGSETTTEKRDAKGKLIESTTRKTTRGNQISGNPPASGTTTVQPQQRVKVKGPNGQIGTVTVDDSKHLPQGWTVIQ